jgi:hypothetical protein
MLIYGSSGSGKTLFASTAPNPIIAACETGHGNGLMTLASSGIPYVTPTSYSEIEQFCTGVGLEAYETIILDGFSYTTDTLVKDEALSIPRQRGSSPKRDKGILELDDYGVLAELERKLLARLLCLDKHILVTALIDYYKPPSEGRPEQLGGPDLPGSMRAGATAMFDMVMKLESRPALRDARDPKSRYFQRTFLCENDGRFLAKSRLRNGTKNIFPTEVVFDPDKGVGTFQWFIAEATKSYSAMNINKK